MATKPQPVNWEALLGSDPVLKAALGQINTAGQADRNALTAARQQAIIAYGALPTSADTALTGQFGADLTPAVGQEAQQATSSGLSALGQAARNYNTAQQGSVASLAARGLLHSGAYRQHATENLAGYQNAQAGAASDVLGKLAAAYSGYLGQQDTLAGRAESATGDASNRLASLIQAGVYASPPAAPKAKAPFAALTAKAQVAKNTTGYRDQTAPLARVPLGAKPLL